MHKVIAKKVKKQHCCEQDNGYSYKFTERAFHRIPWISNTLTQNLQFKFPNNKKTAELLKNVIKYHFAGRYSYFKNGLTKEGFEYFQNHMIVKVGMKSVPRHISSKK
jgi:hypothetical protein